jgi:hypothetical protein
MDNSHHDNWLTIFVLMVDSANILPNNMDFVLLVFELDWRRSVK